MVAPAYRIKPRPDLVQALLPFSVPSTPQGVLRFSVDYGLFVAGTALALLSSNVALRVLGALLAGFKMSGLYAISHDAAHNTLTASRRLNKVLGVVGYLTGFYNYRLRIYDHLLKHHPLVNGPQPDAYRPMSLAQYDVAPAWRRAWERFIRSSNPLALTAYGAASRLLKSEVFPKKSMPEAVRREAWVFAGLMGAYLGALLAGIAVYSAGEFSSFVENTLFALVLPFLAFQTSQASVVYFQHTNPKIPWFSQGDARHRSLGAQELSAHIDMPRRVSSWVHHAYCHAAHHVCPSIPCYHLYDAQRRLNDLLQGTSVTVPFRLSAILDIFRRCKLYDYDRHRWLDFEGNATSPMLLDDDGRVAAFDDFPIENDAAAATAQR